MQDARSYGGRFVGTAPGKESAGSPGDLSGFQCRYSPVLRALGFRV